MKFGVREICDVVFKAKHDMTIGSTTFSKGQPVLYIDTAKTSTMEGNATTVYATGGRGNTRLIAWEGEKTLTFTVEDALLSPIGFAILSGAGLIDPAKVTEVHVHTTANAYASNGSIELTDALEGDETIATDADIYVIPTAADGSFAGTPVKGTADGKTVTATGVNGACFVDFYVIKNSSNVHELQIDAANFAGYFYVEASTLFRGQADGMDYPAEITLPNVKIQSNFNFAMAATGDPSTFSFTMDAFPGYTYFEPTRKVLCAIQIVEDKISTSNTVKTVFPAAKAED